MDLSASFDTRSNDAAEHVEAVLSEVACSWADDATNLVHATAVILHAAAGLLVLEAGDSRHNLPPPGTTLRITGETAHVTGRLAEHGRGGRFLVSTGERPVRSMARMRVSLPGVLRSPSLPHPESIEIVDMTTGGARVRGIELPVGSPVTLDFTPPGRAEVVSVRAVVVHATHRAEQPWMGVAFRLVAMRGGR